MRYITRALLILPFLLSSILVYSANNENIFTKQTQWSPVNSDMSINSSQYNRNSSYSSSNNSLGITSSNSRSSSNRRSAGYISSSPTRGNSFAPRSRSVSGSYYQRAENYSFSESSNNHTYTNNTFESMHSRPGQQRARGLATPDVTSAENGTSNPGGTEDPGGPIEDAIPCLTIMILGVAIWKYRKMI